MQGPSKIFCGSGTPESVVTADAGDFYFDAAAGTFYFKGTGSGATGWVAVTLTETLIGNASTATLAALATLAAGSQDAIVARSTDTSAPITQKTGTVMLTKGSAGAWTLAAPTATTDDGDVLTLIAGTAFAHTVTTPSNKVNGNKHIVTFAAVGDSIELEAYQGVWYSRSVNAAVIS